MMNIMNIADFSETQRKVLLLIIIKSFNAAYASFLRYAQALSNHIWKP